MATDATALDRLRELFRMDRSAVGELLSDWFYTYHADVYRLGVPFDVYEAKAGTIVRNLEGAEGVLDFGAGFGVTACLLRILGVPRVVALDYHFEKARVARKLVDHLGLDGVTVLHGDGTVLPFRAGTFDGAVALACLSHIRDAGRGLDELAGVLRPGGRLLVFEDNNSLHSGYYRNVEPEWRKAEHGDPDNPDPAREPYVAIRRRMIRERFGDLGKEALETCVRETQGLYGEDIYRAVGQFKSKGTIENPRRHLVCSPVNGEFDEYPLNPRIVKDLMRRAGFDPSLRNPHTGPFRGRWRFCKRLAAGFFTLCPWALTRLSPTFSVLGRR